MARTALHIEDLIGKQFGRLTIIEKAPSDATHAYVKCECNCGKIVIKERSQVVNGVVKSCGCLFDEMCRERAKKMGLNSRKYIGCLMCDSDKHYAKGYCRNCYNKVRRLKKKIGD